MRKNLLKARLTAGETVFGVFMRYGDASLAELLALLGWDFIVIDAEHSALEPRDCEAIIRGTELFGVTPIVRVPTNQQPVMLRFLDRGAAGVQVPWINNGADAQALVRSVKYPPLGARGLASVRAADYGQTQTLREYVQEANKQTLIVAQVESTEAVERLPEIVSQPEIDVIFLGPTDLSSALGHPNELDHPDVKRTFEKVTSTILKSKKIFGTMVSNAAAARMWHERGARYITINFEALAVPACTEYLKAARNGSKSPHVQDLV